MVYPCLNPTLLKSGPAVTPNSHLESGVAYLFAFGFCVVVSTGVFPEESDFKSSSVFAVESVAVFVSVTVSSVFCQTLICPSATSVPSEKISPSRQSLILKCL